MVAQMKDVAARAGVSMTTVSQVLNRKRGFSVSPETRQRVLDAVSELKYRQCPCPPPGAAPE